MRLRYFLAIIWVLAMASIGARGDRDPAENTPILRVNLPGQHTYQIQSLDADRSGSFFVTGSVDKTVRVWNFDQTRGLRESSVLRPPIVGMNEGDSDIGTIHAVAISRDARMVAMGGVLSAKRDRVYVFNRLTSSIEHSLPDVSTAVSTVAFSQDDAGRYLAAGTSTLGPHNTPAPPGSGGVRIWDLDARRLAAADTSYSTDVKSVAFTHDGRLLSASSDGKIRIYPKLSTLSGAFSPAVTIGPVRFDDVPKKMIPDGTVFVPWQLAVSPKGERFAVVYSPSGQFAGATTVSRVVAYDLAGRVLWRSTPLFDVGQVTRLTTVAWSANGEEVWSGGSIGTECSTGSHAIESGEPCDRGPARILRFDGNTGDLAGGANVEAVQTLVSGIRGIAGDRMVVASWDPSLAILDNRGSRTSIGARIQEVTPNLIDTRPLQPCSNDGLGLSSDGRVVEIRDRRTRDIFEFDVSAPGLTRKSSPELSLNRARNQGDKLEIKGICGPRPVVVSHSVPNGRDLRLGLNEVAISAAVSPDDRFVAVGGNWSLRMFDASGSEAWPSPIHLATSILQLNFSTDGRFLVGAFGDGTIRWFEAATGKNLLNLFVDHSSDTGNSEWVIWTPNGFFDASPRGVELVGWHVNRLKSDSAAEFYKLALFREKFLRRGLGKLVLESGRMPIGLEPASLRQMLPPTVRILHVGRIQGSRLPIEIEIESPSEARLTALKVTVDGFESEIDPGVSEIKIGQRQKINVLHVRPFSSSVVIEASTEHGPSEPTGETFDRQQALTNVGLLYAVILGVDYANPDLNLRLSVRDAEDFRNQLLRQTLYDVRKENIRLLNSRASLDEVKGALAWLSSRTSRPGSHDTAVLFLAGHGRVVPIAGANGDIAQKYFFLLSETNTLSSETLSQTALSEDALLTALGNIHARKLVFLDTCYAGKIFDDARSFYSNLGDRASIVFAAAGPKELAHECPKFSNGCLTAAVIERLKTVVDPYLPREVTPSNLHEQVLRNFSFLSGQKSWDDAIPYILVPPADNYPIFNAATEVVWRRERTEPQPALSR